MRAYGTACSVADSFSDILAITTARGIIEKLFKMGHMTGCNLLSSRKLIQESVYRLHMKIRDELFQLREQDSNETGNRLFQLSPFMDLVETISG
jgi:hypothetical protein